MRNGISAVTRSAWEASPQRASPAWMFSASPPSAATCSSAPSCAGNPEGATRITRLTVSARRPENPIGWLYLGFGATTALHYAAGAYAEHALVTDPGSLPAANVAASLGILLLHPGFGFLVFSLLLFPNGRLLSARWRWVARATALTYGALAVSAIFDSGFARDRGGIPFTPLFTGAADAIGSAVFGLFVFINVLLLLVAAGSLVLRLRRARGEERQQVKVFVYTVACVLFLFPFPLFLTPRAYGFYLFPLIPISAAVAILRYRLYDIDVVIKRTLIYGTLTAVLGGAYLLSVLALQWALSPSSDLAVAGSTLAVAAIFRPARTRIQALVDRRFYRGAYDAARTVEEFGAQLRNEVSLEALTEDLRIVVTETMHPAHVSVWLR